MRLLPGLPGLIRLAVLAVLGLVLLLAGCASARAQTAGHREGGAWESGVTASGKNRPTVLCFQR